MSMAFSKEPLKCVLPVIMIPHSMPAYSLEWHAANATTPRIGAMLGSTWPIPLAVKGIALTTKAQTAVIAIPKALPAPPASSATIATILGMVEGEGMANAIVEPNCNYFVIASEAPAPSAARESNPPTCLKIIIRLNTEQLLLR